MSTKEFERSRKAVRRPMWLLLGFWTSIGIAIAAVVRRLVALSRPATANPPQTATLNATFSSHAVLTLSHIVPAAAFVVLAPVVLLLPSTSKWPERSFFVFGVITGVTAYLMSAFAIGGWVERSAVLVFDTWFLFSLRRAYCYKETALRREWMTRAVAVLLGIATTRPVMGIFFATSAATHLRARPVLRIRILDRLLYQHPDYRALVAFQTTCIDVAQAVSGASRSGCENSSEEKSFRRT